VDVESYSVKDVASILLGELGANLALGEPNSSGSLVTSFSVRRWNFKIEQALESKRQQKGKGVMSLHRYISFLFSELCTNFGPFDFEAMNEAERLAALNTFAFADIMTAYTWIRKQCIGEKLQLDVTCPSCGSKFTYVADLNSLTVRTAKSIDDLKWTYSLLEPFAYGKEQVTEIEFGPLRWHSLANAKIELGARKPQILCSSVLGINGRSVVVPESQFAEMGKRDLETILYWIDKNAIGPEMILEVSCPTAGCGTELKKLIDWGYDSFFSVSFH